MTIRAAIALALAVMPAVALAQDQASRSAAPSVSAAVAAALPDCRNQLAMSFDGEGGAFNGMSHSGALLVLRNIGPAACKAPGLPGLSFRDAKGRALAIARSAPLGMHPGPVVRPVGIAAGAEATAPLRWVSGDVYDGHHCLAPAKVVVSAGGETATLAWLGQMCGPPVKVIPFEQPVLKTDPVVAGAKLPQG